MSNPIFDGNGTWFLAILPLQDGSRGRFPEMCEVDSASRKFIYLTTPPMIVLEILAWDLRNHMVWVQFLRFSFLSFYFFSHFSLHMALCYSLKFVLLCAVLFTLIDTKYENNTDADKTY